MKISIKEYRKAAKANPALSMEEFFHQRTGRYPAIRRAVVKTASAALRLLRLDATFAKAMHRRAARLVAEAKVNGGWFCPDDTTVMPLTQAGGDLIRQARADAAARAIVSEASHG